MHVWHFTDGEDFISTQQDRRDRLCHRKAAGIQAASAVSEVTQLKLQSGEDSSALSARVAVRALLRMPPHKGWGTVQPCSVFVRTIMVFPVRMKICRESAKR